MSSGTNIGYTLPPDDQGPFSDLDRIRINMLNEAPPVPVDALHEEGEISALVLCRLQFFRWLFVELYEGDISAWEGSLERRDERLRAVRCRALPAGK